MYSYKTLAQRITEDGFYPKNKACSPKLIEKMLKNPFYMGEFEFNGKRYSEANHTPLITKELFLECKKIRQRRDNPRKIVHEFLYSGLIKCAHCGCQLTAEIKKGKYIYYHCTGNKGGHCKSNKYLKEEHIDLRIKELLEMIQPRKEDAEAILDRFKKMVNASFEYDRQSMEEIGKKISLLKNRLEKLYIDKLDGLIDDNFYIKKKTEFQNELDELEAKHSNFISETDELVDMATQIIELCKNAYSYYLQADNEKKHLLLNILCSNFLYDGSNIEITLKSTIQPMLLGANFKNGGD